MAASSRLVTLAYSEGFRMAVLPAASAGATFHTALHNLTRRLRICLVQMMMMKHFKSCYMTAGALVCPYSVQTWLTVGHVSGGGSRALAELHAALAGHSYADRHMHEDVEEHQ